MQIFQQFKDFISDKRPLTMTIGNFDGVHRGHAAVFRRCREVTVPEGRIVVITFRNHPSEILRPHQPVPLLCTLSHRIKLIQAFGIDILFLLPFTNTLAKQSATSFIERVRSFVPFSYLILGYDATMGRDRQGNQTIITGLASQWGFNLEYLEEYRYEGSPVSSSKIRQLLQEGNLGRVEDLLGRPYSIYGSALPDIEKETQPGISNLHLDVTGLCLPPHGTYAVTVKKNNLILPSIAHLNLTDPHSPPLLHIQISSQDLYGKDIEVIFHHSLK